jgi:hypothetical protein
VTNTSAQFQVTPGGSHVAIGSSFGWSTKQTDRPIRFPFPKLSILGFLLIVPSRLTLKEVPFDTGFTSLQTLFTGTVAKVASLIAIVIGGYGFALHQK